MRTSEETQEIFEALAKFRTKLKQPLKDASNPFFKSKYVPLENIVQVIDEAIVDTGLSYSQEATSKENSVLVATHVFHESGQFISFDPLALPATKSDAQGFGSAVTYAKRYSLAAVFGVTSDEDDDGNKATETAPKTISQQNQMILTKLISDFGESQGVDYKTTWATIQRRTNIHTDIAYLTEEQSAKIKHFINEHKK
ncbi:TPA: ERF family protein [Enterococcus faecium]